MSKILKPIDYVLNRITMYRLVLYYLSALLVVAGIFGYFNIMPYQPTALLFSVVFIFCVCWIVNKIISWMFDAPTNLESVYITALILALIISPLSSIHDGSYFALAVWASVWAMASKYLLQINKKHIFNPAAFGVAITSLFLGLSATWWVGSAALAPFVLVGGLMIARKIRRFDLVLSFFVAALVMIFGYNIINGHDLVNASKAVLLDTPLLFFAFIMLTEPQTTPPTRGLRMTYGALTGALYAPFINVAGVYSTPELALLVGNIFSYIVSPKHKLVLTLVRRDTIAAGTYDFVFSSKRRIHFKAGQYMEWTLPHESFDSRGNRRYFTIASSPTEKEIHIGVKFYQKPSTFKSALINLKVGDTIIASQLSGDFTLPKNKNKKIVCIAGGIGVTPFRSMIKYLIDTDGKRSVTLFYSNKEFADIAYTDIFDEAYEKIDLKTIYTLTDKEKVPPTWRGGVGFIDENMLKREVPDYQDCIYYLSGPQTLVVAFEELLAKMGVKKTNIKTDYFPGFA